MKYVVIGEWTINEAAGMEMGQEESIALYITNHIIIAVLNDNIM